MGRQRVELYLKVTWSASVDRAAWMQREHKCEHLMSTTAGMNFNLDSPLLTLTNENARDY